MRGWSAVVALVGLLCVPFAWAEEACPPLRALAVVDIAPVHGNIGMPVAISGQSRTMLLDTGATSTAITPQTVTELNLKTVHSRVGMVDALGNRSDMVATLPSLSVGALSAKDVKVSVLPFVGGAEKDLKKSTLPTVAGLFGADFLRMYDVDIDFVARKARLVSQDHCRIVPYWHPSAYSEIPITVDDRNKIIIWVTLDGVDLKAMIDTGATRSVMPAAVARKKFGLDADALGKNGVVNNEKVSGVFRHKFKMLSMKGLEIANPEIMVLPDVEGAKQTMMERESRERTAAAEPDLILGIHEHSRLHVYIAYKDHRLYASAAKDRDAPAVSAPAAP